ncbi:hypothetical protein [Brevundimonas sp.]|uniref:hypothetical protein n=1 Tax=Brevundimonas sp. TaxID=1871086 RepID=UPI0039E22A6E
MTAEYHLQAPTLRFEFDGPLPVEARVTVIEDGVSFAADAVTFDRPLTVFSLLVRPDRVRVDARYPVVSRLGEGWMIHVPSLLGQAGPHLSDVTIEPGPGWILIPGPGSEPLNGFVYVGPDRPGSSGGTKAISDPALPDWLVADSQAALDSSAAFYAAGLNIVPPGEPVLFVGALPEEDRRIYVGDVTPNGVINLQFATHMLPPERDRRFIDLVVPFVAHETFHVWQGDRYREVDGVNGRWLTEGGAEYFSLLAQSAVSPAAADRSREVLAQRLGRCLSRMDAQTGGLVNLAESEAEATRYDCGTVSQWLADLQMSGSGGLFALWRHLLTLPDGYGVEDFRSSLSEHPAQGATGQAALLDGAADIRRAVIAALSSLGVDVEIADPGPWSWANAALWPLLQSNCSGMRGIAGDNGRFTLDTGDRCGPLSGDMEAVAIAGHRFDTAGAAAFHAVEVACSSQDEVAVNLLDGETARTVSVSCDQPSPPPELAYRIVAVPD